MQLGEIYKTDFDDRPFRVIGFDAYEVFYDCLWSDNSWTFSGNFKRKTIFYRMSIDFFKSKSKLIGLKELTEKESQYFRPDLPMRFGRTRRVNWNLFDSQAIDYLNSEFANRIMNTKRIVLVPFGLKGGYGKGVIVESESNLTEFEIIIKAKEIQESINNQVSDGIGIYRLGFEKGLPRYSIGQYRDRARIMKE